jgi:hypothetical protein
MRYHFFTVLVGADSPGAPSLHPDAGGLPGAATLQRLADGIGGWALIAAMMGIVVGAVLWASGRQTTRRKTQVSRALSTDGARRQCSERDKARVFVAGLESKLLICSNPQRPISRTASIRNGPLSSR